MCDVVIGRFAAIWRHAASGTSRSSRVIDAQEMCRSSGGQKEWIYESVETIGGAKPLGAGNLHSSI
jgi:plasmid replication initiation protein